MKTTNTKNKKENYTWFTSTNRSICAVSWHNGQVAYSFTSLGWFTLRALAHGKYKKLIQKAYNGAVSLGELCNILDKIQDDKTLERDRRKLLKDMAKCLSASWPKKSA